MLPHQAMLETLQLIHLYDKAWLVAVSSVHASSCRFPNTLLEKRNQSNSVLFLNPHQRNTLEASRLRYRDLLSTNDSHCPAADLKPFYDSTEEDMDISSDSEDYDIPRVRSASPVESIASSREPTPALSVGHSDGESAIVELEMDDWPDHDSNGTYADSSNTVRKELVCQEAEFSFGDPESLHDHVPLFLPSPHTPPRPLRIARLSNSLGTAPLRTDSTTPALFPEAASPTSLQQPACAIRSFLHDLRRPLGHHYSALYDIGVRTEEDLCALSCMSGDWEIIQAELSKRGVTLMEWLYIKAGLEMTRQRHATGLVC